MNSNDYILDRLETLDRKIDRLESDVVMMNKQIGKRISEIRILKEERERLSSILQSGAL